MKIVRASLSVLCLLAIVCAAGCRKSAAPAAANSALHAYDTETDWNDPQHVIPLNYQQAQGKRIFYEQCVWCHADSTPAGPSNRSNVSPAPSLMNDGAALNAKTDEFLQNIITLGGSAMGKSPMMPPYGQAFSKEDIRSVIAFTRAIAVPPYQPPARPIPGSQ